MFKTTIRILTPLRLALAVFCCVPLWALAANSISAIRYWPAADYSRLTIESAAPLEYKLFTLNNPDRLVIDLTGVDNTPAMQALSEKIGANDPWIAKMRAGINRPGVLRLVLDLRSSVKPSLFALKPVGNYANRLVLDVYPANAAPAVKTTDKTTNNGEQPDLAQTESTVINPNSTSIPESVADATIAEVDKPPITDKKKVNQSIFEVTRLITIAIDPGHGGEDPGAHGEHGTLEKNVTLAIARRVQAKLNQIDNIHAVLTRDGDYFIPLAERVNKARRMNADLFVSIHADAFIRPDASGSSVFTLSEHGATSAAARWLAKSENNADLVGGINVDVKDKNLARTLIDLSQTATNNDSRRLAHSVLDQLSSVNRLHRGQVEEAGFAVLKAPDIPSILVETAFISNPEEEKRLSDEAYQDHLASAIVDGIKRYFASNPATARSKLAAQE